MPIRIGGTPPQGDNPMAEKMEEAAAPMPEEMDAASYEMPAEMEPNMGKMPMEEVEYLGAEAGPFQCSTCMYFMEPNGCQVVDGEIDPAGICRVFMPGHAAPTAEAEPEIPAVEEEAPVEEEVPAEEV